MSNVVLYERTSTSFAAGLAKRGHHIVYRTNQANHCPGCGRSNWYVGRVSAECGFCGAAVPLAEASRRDGVDGASARPGVVHSADQRRHKRRPAAGRKLKLLIDGCPTNFALHNISEGGVMGEHVAELVAGSKVQVRFEGGVLVPAVVSWVEDGLVGLAFTDPILLDQGQAPH
jgi:hypothetical protein